MHRPLERRSALGQIVEALEQHQGVKPLHVARKGVDTPPRTYPDTPEGMREIVIVVQSSLGVGRVEWWCPRAGLTPRNRAVYRVYSIHLLLLLLPFKN